MYKKCMILSFLFLFLTACGSTEVIKYVDKPVLVFPSEALLEPERVPVIKGDDVSKYETHGHVKAITYNDMFIKEEKGKVVIQVVLDV